MTTKTTTKSCPACGSSEVGVLIYGNMPGDVARRLEARGAILAGCVVGRPGGDPNVACRACGHEWRAVRAEKARKGRTAPSSP